MKNLRLALDTWRLPPLPAPFRLPRVVKPGIAAVSRLLRQQLADAHGTSRVTEIEAAIVDWLCELVQYNVKRGRAFELEEVLSSGRADCLGYAKLLSAIAPIFGMTLGIVEVVIDNAGRFVPHHANLLKLDDGTYRFIDLWYGSKEIRHRRIGALIKGSPRDISQDELDEIEDLQGLPDRCIEAIDLYIRGNRAMQKNQLKEAIAHYSRAIELYPNNSRAFYNRAIARDREGNTEAARLDYQQALKDETGVIRVLATVEELERLIKLDEMHISDREQDIYLWHKGFNTGEAAGFTEIGCKYNTTPEAVREVVLRIDALFDPQRGSS